MNLTLPITGTTRKFITTNGKEIFFNSGIGGIVVDTEGKEYFDFVLGLGPVSIGHANSEFNSMLLEQLTKGVLLPTYSFIHTEYCELLSQHYPNWKTVCLFKSSSEAVAAALRLVGMRFTQKGIIRCGYIGWHDVHLACTPKWHAPRGSLERESLYFTQGMRGVSDMEPVYNWLDDNISTLESLLVKYEKNISCFICDFYALGDNALDKLRQLQLLCRKRGVAIIVDETKTSGRLNPGGITMDENVDVDFVILGKAIGNGIPLASLMVKNVNDWNFTDSRIGGTFSRDTLGAAAGVAQISLMTQWNGYLQLPRTGIRVCNTINKAIDVAQVSQFVKVVPMFSGALFELRYSQLIVKNIKKRALLERCFIDNGILIMDGHCNYICLEHENIDWENLTNSCVKALLQWKTLLLKLKCD